MACMAWSICAALYSILRGLKVQEEEKNSAITFEMSSIQFMIRHCHMRIFRDLANTVDLAMDSKDVPSNLANV